MAFDAGAAYGKFIIDDSQAQSSYKRVGKASQALGSTFAGLGKAAIGLGAAFVGAITPAILKANEWQKSFANVSTLVDTTKVDMQGMAKDLLSLGGELGSAKDLTEGLYQAISASVKPSKAIKFVGNAAKFAKAALVDTNTAVDVITTGLNAYGLEAEQSTDISDKLFSVIRLGKTTGDELSSTIGQSIPLAANMGVSFDELGASIAIMTRQGIKSAEATTQFNGVINALLKPTDAMSAALKEMGFESGEAAIETLGFKGTIDKLVQSTGGSKEEMAEMFSNTRALRGVLALTGKGAQDFDSVLNEITNSAGATNEAFKKQEITFETFKNTSDKLLVVTGNVAKSFADELAVGATEAAQSMIDFLVSAQGAEVVSSIIGGVSAAFQFLNDLLGPFVETILSELGKTWETITDALQDSNTETQEASGVMTALASSVQLAGSALKVVGSIIRGVIVNVKNFVNAIAASGGVIGGFFDVLSGKKSWEDLGNQLDTAKNAFANFGTGMVDSVVDAFGVVFDEATTFTDNVKNQAKDLEVGWKVTFNAVKNDAKDSYGELITGQKKASDAITSGAKDLANDLNEIRQQNVEGHITALEVQHEADLYAKDQAIMVNSEKWLAITEADNAAFARSLALEKKKRKEAKKTAKTIVDYAQKFGQQAFNIAQMFYDNEQLALENQLKNQEISEEEYNKKKAELQTKAAKAAKAAAIFGAVISTAQGVAAALAIPPPPVGIALAAVVGALGAVQIGIIASQPIPQFQEGGQVQPGFALVGEEGPELVEFGSPAQITPAAETREILGAKETVINNTFNISNDVDAELAARELGRRYEDTLRAFS